MGNNIINEDSYEVLPEQEEKIILSYRSTAAYCNNFREVSEEISIHILDWYTLRI